MSSLIDTMFAIRSNSRGKCIVTEEKIKELSEENGLLVARNGNQHVLKDIARNINDNIPRVLCSVPRIDCYNNLQVSQAADGCSMKILEDFTIAGLNNDVFCNFAETADSDGDESNSDISELNELEDNDNLDPTSTENHLDTIIDKNQSIEQVRFSAGEKPHSSSFELSTLTSSPDNLKVSPNHCEDGVTDNSLVSLIDSSAKDNDQTYAESEIGTESDNNGSQNVHENNSPEKKSEHESFNNSYSGVACAARDDREMFVVPSGKRRKKNFCLYCKTEQSVISRHLETRHRDEKEVKKFAILQKGNPERKKIIETLRFKGNHIYNTNTKFNDGELKVSRQPQERMAKTANSFMVCHHCLGWFARTSIRRHRQRCIGKSSKDHRSYTILSRKVAGRLHHLANSQVREVIFPVLREDDICRLIRYDEILILFANKLAMKYTKQQQHDMIRARLRLLGRFLRTLKEVNSEIDCFMELYNPKYYDTVVKAINIEAGYDEQTHEYASPSVASTLGNYIKKVGKHLIIECIKRENDVMKKSVEDFLTVHDEEFNVKVNKLAVEITNKNNRKRQKPLPTMEDISKLRNHLGEKWKNYYPQLQRRYSFDIWLELLQVTLITIQLFNRRRAGEIERLLIEDFNGYEKIDEVKDKAVFDSLSKHDQELAKKYVRFEMIGKLGRNVPVLLSEAMLETINLLLKYRVSAKIHPSNPFVFGIPGFDQGRYKHLRACILMRKFANECGAENAERLRGTTLRKHVATRCAERNIDENKICDIAKFMGHAEKVHHDNYRRPVAQRDLCGISKVLENAVGLTGDIKDSNMPTSSKNQQDEFLNPTSNRKNKRSFHSKRAHLSSTDSDDSSSQFEPRKQKIRSRTQKHHKDGSLGSMNVTQISREHQRRFAISEDREINSDDDISCRPKRNKRGLSVKSKIRWSEEEKQITRSAFSSHIKRSCLPSVVELRELIAKYPCLKRTEAQIRTWVSNQIAASKRY